MPYSTYDIQKLLDINNQAEKSKITSLYFSLPSSCNLFTGFEQYRNIELEYSDWNYWKNLISYSIERNLDFIYLLNNPTRLTVETVNFSKQLEKLDNLLNELRKLGVNKLRIANHKLLSYLNKYYSDFQLYASTSFEFKILSEYQNFIFVHPYIKQIVPSHDTIKNFKLLKNLRRILLNTDIELMVNEGCLNGCPVRYAHASDSLDIRCINTKNNQEKTISNYYYTKFFCTNYENQNSIHVLNKINNIYPWEIEEYAKIGITKFKLAGRDGYEHFEKYIKYYTLYFKGIDNTKNIQDSMLIDFIHHLHGNKNLQHLTVKDYKKYLPNIKHFKKYGHLCASRCAVECRYCYNCAEKIQKVFKKKQQEQMKRTVPFCKKLNTNLETVKN